MVSTRRKQVATADAATNGNSLKVDQEEPEEPVEKPVPQRKRKKKEEAVKDEEKEDEEEEGERRQSKRLRGAKSKLSYAAYS